MFEDYIERPVFNLLELIFALEPGHDLGVSIIIFTALVRLALWPLVKKQLHQSRAMRKLAPELKRIKKEAGKDRQKLARMQMELYKEHGIKPASTILVLLLQLPIFTGLYFTIRKLIYDPNSLQTFSYSSVRDLPFIRDLANGTASFDPNFIGLVDLSLPAIGNQGFYLGAFLIVIASSIIQYKQSKQLLPDTKDAKKLSEIMRSAANGEEADQSDVANAVNRQMVKFLPFMIALFTITLPSALALYFLTSAAVGYAQQTYILRKDSEELEDISEEPEPAPRPKKAKNKKSSSSKKKRRK